MYKNITTFLLFAAIGFLIVYFLLTLLFFFRDSYNGEANILQSRYIQHPFLTASFNSNYISSSHDYPIYINGKVKRNGYFELKTNSLGFRDKEFVYSKSESVTRVCFLGGSALVTGQSNSTTIPSLVAKKLTTSPVSFEIYNFGSPGRASTQELFLLHTEILKYSCNLLVVYHGRNDAFNGSMPVYKSHWDPWDHKRMKLLESDKVPLWEKYFYIVKRLQKVKFIQSLQDSNQDEYFTQGYNRHNSKYVYKYNSQLVNDYIRNLDSLVVISKANEIKVIVIHQPNMTWDKDKPYNSYEKKIYENLNGNFLDAMKKFKLPLIHAAENIAKKHNITYVNYSELFTGDSRFVYLDDVHLSEYGNSVISEKMTNLLIKESGIVAGRNTRY